MIKAIGSFAQLGLCAVGMMMPATAQQSVVPRSAARDLAQVEGNSSFHLPGRYAPSRLLVVYRRPVKSPMTLRTIALRRDGLKTSSYRAHRWRFRIDVSSQGVLEPVFVTGDSFDAAHGGDRVRVLDRKFIDFPALPKPKQGPAPFAVRVRLDRSFVVGADANLAIDFQSETTSGQRETFYWYADSEDYAAARAAQRGSARIQGRGCPFAFQARANVPPLDGESLIETWAYTRVTKPSVAFLVTGSRRDLWKGQQLPLSLDPNGSCLLYTNPLTVVARPTLPNDARGTVRFFGAALARDARFVGLTLYQQALVVDPAANALGLRSSNLLELKLGKIGEPLAARMLYHSGPDVKPEPTAIRDAGLVLELSSQ